MKKGHAIFESILISITIVLGIGVYTLNDLELTALIWLTILGFSQILHSFIIAFSYWKNKKIIAAIIIYWIGSAVTLLLVSLDNFPRINNSFLTFLGLLAFPLTLALYLWGITYFFREKELKSNSFTP